MDIPLSHERTSIQYNRFAKQQNLFRIVSYFCHYQKANALKSNVGFDPNTLCMVMVFN